MKLSLLVPALAAVALASVATAVPDFAVLGADGRVIGRYTIPADKAILAEPNAGNILCGFCPTMSGRR